MKDPFLMVALRSLVGSVCLGSMTALACADAGEGAGSVMRGMYRYMADAAIFTECRTGKSFPVAFEEDNRALEEAYLSVPHPPGEPLLVTLEGRIVKRMPMEGPGPVSTIVPVRFIGISPGEICDMPGR